MNPFFRKARSSTLETLGIPYRFMPQTDGDHDYEQNRLVFCAILVVACMHAEFIYSIQVYMTMKSSFV